MAKIDRKVVNKHIQLSVYEANLLRSLAAGCGRSEVDVIRNLLLGYRPPEKPDKEFYDCMNEIRKIGVNINQIAHIANATGVIDAENLRQETSKLDRLVVDLKRICLEPTKKQDLVDLINKLECVMWDTLEDQHKCWEMQQWLKDKLGITTKALVIGNGDY